MNFGLLRVLNDDQVAAARGFGAHPHANMEIISIPLSGELNHRDNTGRSEVINSGDVQIMSAGSGITHSEMNASISEPVNFLQLWIFPEKENITPRYEQKTFHAAARNNQIQFVVSPDKTADTLWINQSAWIALADLSKYGNIDYVIHSNNNGLYIFVIEGQVNVDNESLSERDAIGINNSERVTLASNEISKLLFIEVPMS